MWRGTAIYIDCFVILFLAMTKFDEPYIENSFATIAECEVVANIFVE